MKPFQTKLTHEEAKKLVNENLKWVDELKKISGGET